MSAERDRAPGGAATRGRPPGAPSARARGNASAGTDATPRTDGRSARLGLGSILPAAFFARGALELAPDLLGLVLAHETGDGAVTAGRIVEVEAYCGPDDLAAHTAGGRRTTRNEVMWGRAGVAYVYFVYGMHWCVNVVAARAGLPEAVLIRAIAPLLGIEHMRARRGARVRDAELGRGPGNLTRALGITREQNGADLRRGPLRVLRPDGAPAIDATSIVRSPRVGVAYAGTWALLPWRFSLRDHPSVSRPPRPARPA